jgi:hypothetical protein
MSVTFLDCMPAELVAFALAGNGAGLDVYIPYNGNTDTGPVKGRKQFFFEKKNQKTFDHGA